MTGFEVTTETLLLGGLTGYLVGSIPFAYLITKSKTGKDLRREGTGNIGTANAYDVTGKKSIGILVLLADMLKGLIPVVVFESLGLHQAILVLAPALVLGHCYPLWLRFHGGRGLATAAGAAFAINPPLVFFWLLTYFLARKIKDQVHFGAILATSATLAVDLLLPLSMLERSTLAFSGLDSSVGQLAMSIALLLLIILSRHIQPFMKLLRRGV